MRSQTKVTPNGCFPVQDDIFEVAKRSKLSICLHVCKLSMETGEMLGTVCGVGKQYCKG